MARPGADGPCKGKGQARWRCAALLLPGGFTSEGAEGLIRDGLGERKKGTKKEEEEEKEAPAAASGSSKLVAGAANTPLSDRAGPTHSMRKFDHTSACVPSVTTHTNIHRHTRTHTYTHGAWATQAIR